MSQSTDEEIKRFYPTHKSIQKAMSCNLYINCWNISEHEDSLMWKAYGDSNNTVAIETNLESLIKVFKKYSDYNIYMGMINYIDFEVEEIDISNYFSQFLHKNIFYKNECELRCIFWDDGDNSIITDEDIPFSSFHFEDTLTAEDYEKIPDGILIPVQVEELIHRIFINPNADKEFEAELVEVIDASEFDLEIKHSFIKP